MAEALNANRQRFFIEIVMNEGKRGLVALLAACSRPSYSSASMEPCRDKVITINEAAKRRIQAIEVELQVDCRLILFLFAH